MRMVGGVLPRERGIKQLSNCQKGNCQGQERRPRKIQGNGTNGGFRVGLMWGGGSFAEVSWGPGGTGGQPQIKDRKFLKKNPLQKEFQAVSLKFL